MKCGEIDEDGDDTWSDGRNLAISFITIWFVDADAGSTASVLMELWPACSGATRYSIGVKIRKGDKVAEGNRKAA
jgi:hypothetical protein